MEKSIWMNKKLKFICAGNKFVCVFLSIAEHKILIKTYMLVFGVELEKINSAKSIAHSYNIRQSQNNVLIIIYNNYIHHLCNI